MLISKIKACLTLIRPIGWAPFYFPFLLGLIDAGFLSLAKVYLALFIYGPLLAGGIYVLNFYSDIDVDRISKVAKDVEMPKQPFVSGEVSKKEGLILAFILLASGLFLSSLINASVLFVSLLCVFLGVIYSFPPRLKQIPFADIITNSSVGVFCYAAGWLVFRDISGISIYPILWLLFLISSTYLLTVIIDIDGDREAGLKTTAVFLGTNDSVKVSVCLYAISLLFFIIVLVKQINLAYALLAILMLKSPYTFGRLYKDPSLVYKVGKGATVKSIIGFFALLLIYSVIALIGIDDKIVLDEIAKKIWIR